MWRRDRKAFLPLLILLFLSVALLSLAMIIGLIGCNLLFDPEITIYPARIHNGKLIIGNRTTFRVSVDRQEIIYWSPDVKHPPRRLKDCVVLMGEAWSGKYIDGSGSVFMIAGRFYKYPYNPDTIYITNGVGGLLTLRAGFNKIIKYMEKFRLYEKMTRENKRGLSEK